MYTLLSKFRYVLAIIYGIGAFFIPVEEEMQLVLALSVFYFVGGSLLGFFWPMDSWRWGFWVAGPMVSLLCLSFLFKGQVSAKDWLFLLVDVASGCIGAFVAAWYRNKQKNTNINTRIVPTESRTSPIAKFFGILQPSARKVLLSLWKIKTDCTHCWGSINRHSPFHAYVEKQE